MEHIKAIPKHAKLTMDAKIDNIMKELQKLQIVGIVETIAWFATMTQLVLLAIKVMIQIMEFVHVKHLAKEMVAELVTLAALVAMVLIIQIVTNVLKTSLKQIIKIMIKRLVHAMGTITKILIINAY